MTSEATTSRNAPVTPVARGVLFRILAVWTKQELLLLVREPIAVFFCLAFPLVIYVFIGLPYADNEVSSGVRFIDFMFPTLIGTIAANLLVMGLPIYLAELRSKGVDRRYRVMPIPGGIFATAVILATLALVVAASIIIIVVVSVVNGLRPEVLDPVFLGLVLLLISWLCCIGYFLGSLPTSSRTTQAISAAVFFTMFFGSGAAAPIDGLPGWLKPLLQLNPLKHWFDLLPAIYTSTQIPGNTLWKALAVIPISGALALWGLRIQKRTAF